MFSLDIELIDFLKGKNASALVNRLLLEWKDRETCESMTIEQLQAEKDCNKLEREFKTKCKEVRKNALK